MIYGAPDGLWAYRCYPMGSIFFLGFWLSAWPLLLTYTPGSNSLLLNLLRRFGKRHSVPGVDVSFVVVLSPGLLSKS